MVELESGRSVSPAVAADAQRIATELNESLLWLLENVVETLGAARADDLLHQTQAIEAAGGWMTAAGDRRRTPGGVFLVLLKQQASAEELARILTGGPKTKPSPTPDEISPPPMVPLTREEAPSEIAQLIKEPLEKASLKQTILGRPTQVSKTKSCVVVALKGSRPPSLPKGLPLAPDGSDFSYAVFISLKHWAKVAPVMAQDKDERLLVEGYPIFDPKRGVTVILAQSVRTINLARRAASKGA